MTQPANRSDDGLDRADADLSSPANQPNDAETKAPDPGNSGPDKWAAPFADDAMRELLDLVDAPDPVVTAVLAGTEYDPEHTGPGEDEQQREGGTDDL